MVDLVGLVLVLGLIASGGFLIHSMEVARSVSRVRLAAVLSIVFMIAFMVHITRG